MAYENVPLNIMIRVWDDSHNELYPDAVYTAGTISSNNNSVATLKYLNLEDIMANLTKTHIPPAGTLDVGKLKTATTEFRVVSVPTEAPSAVLVSTSKGTSAGEGYEFKTGNCATATMSALGSWWMGDGA